jgi:hypothetical protein
MLGKKNTAIDSVISELIRLNKDESFVEAAAKRYRDEFSKL